MKKNALIISMLAGCLFSCKHPNPTNQANTIYYNGDIVTMEGDSSRYAEALAVKDGKILFVGSKQGADSLKGDSTILVDLKGKALFPGFIDGHAHFGGFAPQAIGANLLPPPDGTAQVVPDLVKILKKWATPQNIALTGWIFGMGYDDSQLKDNKYPTKHDLDSVSTTHPIMIVHISAHFCVVNTKGLELLGITAATPNPDGGVIRREPGSQEPNGVLEELAAIPHFATALTPKGAAANLQFFEAGQNMALSYGYTTAQEGRAMDNHNSFVALADARQLKLDVVSYIDYAYLKYMHTKWNSPNYNNHYRIAGMKITLDGSPQGRTAWRTIPYVHPPDGQPASYKGYPAIPDDRKVIALYDTAYKNNWQVITHTNGDAAIDQLIRTIKPAIKKYGIKDRRNVLIHGQYIRTDQLDSIKKLDLIASLFPLHTFYWGDWHKYIIGDSLGNKISPTRTALNKGLRLTIHTDAPVALPNLMRMVWIAVARTSRSNQIIGKNERLTAYEAIKGITDWSAYQHFEEKTKGTLTRGKLADLVILNKNPLKVPVDTIKNIVVLNTIKEGKEVFNREKAASRAN